MTEQRYQEVAMYRNDMRDAISLAHVHATLAAAHAQLVTATATGMAQPYDAPLSA